MGYQHQPTVHDKKKKTNLAQSFLSSKNIESFTQAAVVKLVYIIDQPVDIYFLI